MKRVCGAYAASAALASEFMVFHFADSPAGFAEARSSLVLQ
jgi:hypothetical protein